jgi:hypothetical protein
LPTPFRIHLAVLCMSKIYFATHSFKGNDMLR